MYSKTDYIRRGLNFVNNVTRPGHKKLSTLMIYSTDLCDSGCKHCLIWARRPVVHLSLEKIIKIMSAKCVSKHTSVGLEGGEFLLHPEADKILAWFSKNHPNYDILSNGLKPDSIIESVKKYRPKRLYMSLDGNKESYQYMRGKDGYDSVLKVIKACKDTVPISAMFTLSPYNNFDDLDHVIGVCKEHKIDVRVGVYNDIEFLDTVEKAHQTDIGSLKSSEKLTFGKVQSELKPMVKSKRQNLNEVQTGNARHTETRRGKN